jgi:hypothetical protein
MQAKKLFEKRKEKNRVARHGEDASDLTSELTGTVLEVHTRTWLGKPNAMHIGAVWFCGDLLRIDAMRGVEYVFGW